MKQQNQKPELIIVYLFQFLIPETFTLLISIFDGKYLRQSSEWIIFVV